jgi:ubiquinone/menaquinone biosynthesis C-methylase UbiE
MLQGLNLGERVLEVGAGPGAATGALRLRAPHVVSLEYSHAFCVKLHSEFADESDVVQGDASTLPFASQVFSAVVAVLVLHHLRSGAAQDRALAEIFRVLRPGGVFVALEITDGWLARVAHMRSTFVPLPPRDATARLQSAGFASVDVRQRSGAFYLRARRLPPSV